MSTKKRTMYLDLNPVRTKRPRALVGAPVLSSPDLNKLKMNSPDLESYIFASGMAQTATPTPSATPSLFLPATEEQRNYAQGFEKALAELQHSDSSQGALQSENYGSCSNSSEDISHMMENSQGSTFAGLYSSGMVKDEPQTVPSMGSPPHSPINMESQEKIKLERKRLRNRVAASKCRRRKLERIANLEQKVKHLKDENHDLSTMVNKLKQQVCVLKEQVMEHMRCGCEIIMPQSDMPL